MKLKELARNLGLSQTTVSRALNGYPEVAESTRARVLAAARELNYRPNTRAQGLATGRARAVGHILPLGHMNEIVNPVFSDFIAGASEVYLKNGYDLVLSVVSEAEEETIYRQMASRGTVDGLIVQVPRVADNRIAMLREIGLPFVMHGRAAEPEDSYDWIDINNRRAFRRATEFLLDLGHTRIALVNGLRTLDFAARRHAGYEEALAHRGVRPDARLGHFDDMTEGFGYEAARKSLALEDPATAFLCSSMIIGLGVRRAIEELGLRLGRDVSVICHDDELSYLSNGGDVPIFTATRSSVRLAGRLCAERVLSLIADPGQAPQQTLLQVELTVGQSTGPVPARQRPRSAS